MWPALTPSSELHLHQLVALHCQHFTTRPSSLAQSVAVLAKDKMDLHVLGNLIKNIDYPRWCIFILLKTPSILCRPGDLPPVLQLQPNEQPRPVVECSHHMCPIQVHWHVKQSYRQYWRVKITVKNNNYVKNYSQWNLVALHPNLKNVTQVFSFNYKPLNLYGNISKYTWSFRDRTTLRQEFEFFFSRPPSSPDSNFAI